MSNNADKRSVSTDALATLGTIITDKEKRDAIHLAVIPMKAATGLRAGQHIKIIDGLPIRCEENEGVGIVDPFLFNEGDPWGDHIQPGQWFWLIIYPRKIQSLRHVWSHPEFSDEQGAPRNDKNQSPVDLKQEAKEWLIAYACQVNPYIAEQEGGPMAAYNTLMNDIENKALVYHGIDMHSFYELKEPELLKKYAEIMLGKPVIYEEFEYFSCTC